MASQLPNNLTLARILAIVPLAAFMAIDRPWAAWGAFVIFVAAGLTDWLDGYLARKMGSVSDVGKFLDPIADKLLVAAVLILLVAGRHLDGWNLVPVLVILGREFIVSGLREYLGQKSISLPVTKLAKWKTASQMVAQGALILAPGLPAAWMINEAGVVLIWIAAALTAITGWTYLRGALPHLGVSS
ncbi:CDP-diacylglycerol--glycerol-3-phosphate 3-phosphatidyltransferase [Limibacillus halophilus]|jgi:cardiolipin synthase